MSGFDLGPSLQLTGTGRLLAHPLGMAVKRDPAGPQDCLGWDGGLSGQW